MDAFLDWTMWLAEWLIVVILIDDCYGISRLHRMGKRKLRRAWRKFWKDTIAYHRRTK